MPTAIPTNDVCIYPFLVNCWLIQYQYPKYLKSVLAINQLKQIKKLKNKLSNHKTTQKLYKDCVVKPVKKPTKLMKEFIKKIKIQTEQQLENFNNILDEIKNLKYRLEIYENAKTYQRRIKTLESLLK